jgi:hypothetical protein
MKKLPEIDHNFTYWVELLTHFSKTAEFSFLITRLIWIIEKAKRPPRSRLSGSVKYFFYLHNGVPLDFDWSFSFSFWGKEFKMYVFTRVSRYKTSATTFSVLLFNNIFNNIWWERHLKTRSRCPCHFLHVD